jgi:dolichol-phosphate mannosyltransferase
MHLVIIPTYNEVENISRILESVLNLKVSFHVLVVDDASKDGTVNAIHQSQAAHPNRIALIQRPGKLGIGTAYTAGFQWGLARNFTYIYEMDADFSHSPEDLEKMAFILEKNDVDLVIGSRYIDGVRVINWPMHRLLLSYFASLYTRLMTGLPIWDTTAGFMGYHRKVLERFDLPAITYKGYVFQIFMKFATWKMGFRLSEFPIIFYERQEGVTKLSSSIFWEALTSVATLRFMYRNYIR